MELKMNKKSRRQYQKENRPARAAAQKSTASGRGTEFNPDYSPIIKDLRRIGLLAGSFLIILIALSFLIN
jgi:hypothetical protein